jgi:MtN3 and saliva related transmembrane protein
LRKQDGQRQSSVESVGSGRRTGADAHQHSPDRPQLKSVPQRAQTTRRPRRIEAVASGVVIVGFMRHRNGGRVLHQSGRHVPLGNAAMLSASLLDLTGAVGATLTTLCWLPQAVKTMREKDTRSLSLPATVTFTLGIALWLAYGIGRGDWPLIAANGITLALMLPIVAMKLRYG